MLERFAWLLVSIASLIGHTVNGCNDVTANKDYGTTESPNQGMGCSSASCSYVAQKIPSWGNGCGIGANNDDSHIFTPACQFHDNCYCRCTDPVHNEGEPFLQKDCDDMFLKMMHEICDADKSGDTTACRKSAYDGYSLLRHGGYIVFEFSVDLCCQCSSELSPMNSTWNQWLRADIEEKPQAYETLKNTILPLLDDTVAFRTYLISSRELAEEVAAEAEAEKQAKETTPVPVEVASANIVVHSSLVVMLAMVMSFQRAQFFVH